MPRVVGSFIPVSLFVYGDDQFANISAPLQTSMPHDTHESAKPSSVPSSPYSLSNFPQLAFFSFPNSPNSQSICSQLTRL